MTLTRWAGVKKDSVIEEMREVRALEARKRAPEGGRSTVRTRVSMFPGSGALSERPRVLEWAVECKCVCAPELDCDVD